MINVKRVSAPINPKIIILLVVTNSIFFILVIKNQHLLATAYKIKI
jgi:hypothetical protein